MNTAKSQGINSTNGPQPGSAWRTEARAMQRQRAAAAKQKGADSAAWKEHWHQKQVQERQYLVMKKCVWYSDFTQTPAKPSACGVPYHYQARQAFKHKMAALGQPRKTDVVVHKKRVLGGPSHLETRMLNKPSRLLFQVLPFA